MRSGFRGRPKPTIEEMTFRLESCRMAYEQARRQIVRLRGAVRDYLEHEGLEMGGPYRTLMRQALAHSEDRYE